MRWMVDKPCLAVGDRVLQKGDVVPEGSLETDVIHRFVEKGYLDLELPKSRPVEKLESKPEPKPEPKSVEKLGGEIEKDEPIPMKKKSRRRVKK